LKNGKPIEHWRGYSACRLCGDTLGTKDMSDGEYVWPEKFEHYVIDHFLVPPHYFVQKVLNETEKITKETESH
jgi:hypothetical protein